MGHRERVYQTEAIVLRRTDWGEADRLLTVFTPKRGKLRLVAKGARKPSSRKSGHVELFSHTQLLVAVGREVDIVTQADTVEAFIGLRRDLLRTTYAYYVAEMAEAFTGEQDENEAVFWLLRATLVELSTLLGDAEKTTETELANVLSLLARHYELRLLSLVGYQPQLFSCAVCGQPLEPQVNYMSAAEGGVVCPACGHDRVGTLELSVNALKILRFLQSREWETCRLLSLSPAGRDEVERVMSDYITYHLERKVRSVDFLRRLQRRV